MHTYSQHAQISSLKSTKPPHHVYQVYKAKHLTLHHSDTMDWAVLA